MTLKLKSLENLENDWDDPDDSDLGWDDSDDSDLAGNESITSTDSPSATQAPQERSKRYSLSLEKLGSKLTHSTHQKVQGRGRGKTGTIQVQLEYDPSADSFETTAESLGKMLQEIVSIRRTIPDWTPERWATFMHTVGASPSWVSYSHVDIWHWIVFGAEVLRQHPEAVSEGMRTTQLNFQKNHAEYDPEKWQEKIDGKMFGGVPIDDPQYSRLVPPVKEQVAAKQAAHIESHMAEAKEAPQTTRPQEQDDATIQKWIHAESMARKPRDTWEGKVDFEFEQMIKYCYSWLRDIGEVPEPLPEGIDLFWARPRPGELDVSEQSVKRRHFITGKVMKFMWKSMQNAKDKDTMLLTNPLSYRVVLAAMDLTKAIEVFATNWETDPDGVNDKELESRVKRRALKYFQAHYPITASGPLATSDPDYVEYLRLCRQYKIQPGTDLQDLEL